MYFWISHLMVFRLTALALPRLPSFECRSLLEAKDKKEKKAKKDKDKKDKKEKNDKEKKDKKEKANKENEAKPYFEPQELWQLGMLPERHGVENVKFVARLR